MVLLLGVFLGFVVSVPPTGPVALLILRRALEGEFRSGLLIGAGTTLADLPYIALGALGYGVLLARYPDVAAGFDLGGAVVLAVIAAQMVRTPIIAGRPPEERRWGDFATGFVLGIANPTRLLTWAVVASIAEAHVTGLSAPKLVAYTLAVAFGQMSWYVVLIGGWRRYGDQVSTGVRTRVTYLIAVGALVLAVSLAVRAIRTLAA